MSPTQIAALTPAIQTTISRRLATEGGVAPLAKELSMRRETVLRLASGSDTHEATLLLAAVRLGLIALGSPVMAISSMPLPVA